ADDVSRQEGEGGRGITAGQLRTQLGDVLRGRAMVLLEVDENIGVPGPHRRGGRIGEVDAAVRNADVVDDGVDLPGRNLLTDAGFDAIAQRRSLFDPDPGRAPAVTVDR